MTTYVADVTYTDGTNEIVRGYDMLVAEDGLFRFIWFDEEVEPFFVPFYSVKNVSSHKEE